MVRGHRCRVRGGARERQRHGGHWGHRLADDHDGDGASHHCIARGAGCDRFAGAVRAASTTLFSALANLIVPSSTQIAGASQADIRGLRFALGNVDIVHVAGITAGKGIVSNELAAAWYEMARSSRRMMTWRSSGGTWPTGRSVPEPGSSRPVSSRSMTFRKR